MTNEEINLRAELLAAKMENVKLRKFIIEWAVLKKGKLTEAEIEHVFNKWTEDNIKKTNQADCKTCNGTGRVRITIGSSIEEKYGTTTECPDCKPGGKFST